MELSNELLSVSPADAARASSLGRTVIFKLLRDGELPSFKVGRRRLIRMTDLRALIDRLAAEAANAVKERAA